MASGAPRLVKKYGNRRLYDTDESRYITLEELEARVRGGVDVRVVDAKTGEDLTQATLTQVIIEGRGAARFLSVPLLTQLVRMGDDALADFLGRYLTATLELYLQTRRGVQTLAPFNPLATVPFAAADALARMFGAQPAWPAPPPVAPPVAPSYVREAPRPPAAAPPPAAATDSAVDELRRELESLKQALRRQPAAGARPRRKK